MEIAVKGLIAILWKIRKFVAVDSGDKSAFGLDDAPSVVPVRSDAKPLRGFFAKRAVGGKRTLSGGAAPAGGKMHR